MFSRTLTKVLPPFVVPVRAAGVGQRNSIGNADKIQFPSARSSPADLRAQDAKSEQNKASNVALKRCESPRIDFHWWCFHR
jgi:hypothetical protein